MGINTVLRLLGHGGTAATQHSRFPDSPSALGPFTATAQHKIPHTPVLPAKKAKGGLYPYYGERTKSSGQNYE